MFGDFDLIRLWCFLGFWVFGADWGLVCEFPWFCILLWGWYNIQFWVSGVFGYGGWVVILVFCVLGFVVVCICVWVSGLASFGFLDFGIFGVVWGFDLLWDWCGKCFGSAGCWICLFSIVMNLVMVLFVTCLRFAVRWCLLIVRRVWIADVV